MSKPEKSTQTPDNNSRSMELIELEQDLKTINPKIFDGINNKKKQELLNSFSITMIKEKSHSGPLPDAETLIKYNTVIPEGADRIMKMAEKQQEHRMASETKMINNHNNQGVRGQWFGFLIGLFGIGCGTFLAYSGENIVGGVIAGTTVVSLVSVFVIGRRLENREG